MLLPSVISKHWVNNSLKTKLNFAEEVKYLGVTIDTRLTWNSHNKNRVTYSVQKVTMQYLFCSLFLVVAKSILCWSFFSTIFYGSYSKTVYCKCQNQFTDYSLFV